MPPVKAFFRILFWQGIQGGIFMQNENKNTAIDAITLSKKDKATKKTTYRTRKKAGETAEIPNKLPIITNSKYQNAMTLNKNATAYLQPISSIDNLKYKNGTLLYKGLPMTSKDINNLCTEDCIEKINLSLLRALYAIILNCSFKSHPTNQASNSVFTIYYPDFAKKIGKSSNIGKNDVNEFIRNIVHLQTVLGVIGNGAKANDILPVLTNIKTDSEKNTISFTCPYMTRLIRDIYHASIRVNKKGEPLLKKNGEPQMSPSYSYLIDMSIVKEKNKKAVEIVFIVITLIEQAGNNTPHIRAKTIIDRNRLLSESLERQSNGGKNTLLKRAFKKAWELLRTKTSLDSAYKNICLPDPEDISSIPTSSTLNMVFRFSHEGKTKT